MAQTSPQPTRGWIEPKKPFDLSTSQKAVVEQCILCCGRSRQYQGVFYTGPAGVGKSTVADRMRETINPVILAPTGRAAIVVRGQTLHSFFGIRPGDTEIRRLGEKKAKALRKARALLFDECSMIRADLLDLVNKRCQVTLENTLPFGGKSVIFTGDFHQIEPVVSTEAESEMLADRYRSPMAFDSDVWRETNLAHFELTEVFRQTDPEYIEALHKCRIGDRGCLKYLNTLVSNRPAENAVILTYTNQKARAINGHRLSKLDGEERIYTGSTRGEFGRELPTEENLLLKVGARVMTLCNEEGYHNGDTGTIEELHEDYVVVKFDRGPKLAVVHHEWEKLEFDYNGGDINATVVGTYKQIPLGLAWAGTVHKSQGQTFEAAHLMMDTEAFAYGLLYVALSRSRSPQGLTLQRPLKATDITFNPRVREWTKEMVKRV